MVDVVAAGASYDYIVVGGGSAGCVMASRLSEDPSSKVLLIEAGDDFAPGQEPDVLADPAFTAVFAAKYFKYVAVEGAGTKDGGEPVRLRTGQGSVMGGGSSVNGMHAQRGEASDYDEWRQLGVTGWGWDDVLPFFIKMEDDLDHRGPAHGSSGPVKIKRQAPETWSELSRAVGRNLQTRNIPYIDDLNDCSGDAYGAVPLNATERRVSSASAYLDARVRARKNLVILSKTNVDRLLFDGQRVTGVKLAQPDGRFIAASNVVVCCGAVMTPQLIMRSGIGPAGALTEAGVALVADRPGVGQNFQNHAWFNLFGHVARAGKHRPNVQNPCPMIARYTSGTAGCQPTDMVLNLWERVGGSPLNNPMGDQFATFMMILNKPYSVGEITLNPAQPDGPARVRTNLLSDPRDLERMVNGFRFAAELALAAQGEKLLTDVFALKPDPALFDLFRGGLKAHVVSTLGAFALGSSSIVRNAILKGRITPIETILADDATLEAHVRKECSLTHSGGTCRIGDPNQRETVVDEHCRVVGVEGVRIVDASIFPRLMRGGTNLPTMMAAEKAAHSIRQGN